MNHPALLFDKSIIPTPVIQICELLGMESTFVVGGILRDSIQTSLPLPNQTIDRVSGHDWDLATPLPPQEVMRRLRQAGITAVPIGIEHGTVAAVINQIQYEITTFRHDLEYHDGRHPTVRFTDSLEEDLRRRDFTINAFALETASGAIIDLFDGISDLQARIIRTVGDPETRFQEDHLRMIRACRFAAKLQGGIEPNTLAAISKLAHQIRHISAERIRDEIMKMLGYETPSLGFLLMEQTGLLKWILPELSAGFGVGQNRFHADDVATHTLLTIDALDPAYPFYRFVALLHDLGKIPCKQYRKEKGDYVFYGHQFASKRMAKRIMQRLRFSNKEIQSALSIVENHMYNLQPGLSEGAVRRFIRKLGRENVEGFLRMRMADRRGNRLNSLEFEKGIFHFLRTVRKIDEDDSALRVSDLKISGYDLMKLGLQPCPAYSQILEALLERVLDDPELNETGWLLENAKALIEEHKETGRLSSLSNAPANDGSASDGSAGEVSEERGE